MRARGDRRGGVELPLLDGVADPLGQDPGIGGRIGSQVLELGEEVRPRVGDFLWLLGQGRIGRVVPVAESADLHLALVLADLADGQVLAPEELELRLQLTRFASDRG